MFAFIKNPIVKKMLLIIVGALGSLLAEYAGITDITKCVEQTKCAPPVICPDCPTCKCPEILKIECTPANTKQPEPDEGENNWRELK